MKIPTNLTEANDLLDSLMAANANDLGHYRPSLGSDHGITFALAMVRKFEA